jgi:hypothetical protein
MNKLSELVRMEKVAPAYYGVEVDCLETMPPVGLKEIGLLYAVDETGEMDMDLMDVVLSYVRSGVEVILEIPAEIEVLDPEVMVTMMENLECSIALLPPQVISPETRNAYVARVIAFTIAYLAEERLSRFVYPVSSFIQYMFMEVLSNVSSFKPDDEYIVSRFMSKMPEDFVDEFKGGVRRTVYEVFGGETQFRNVAKGIVFKIFKEAEKRCDSLIERAKGQPVVGDVDPNTCDPEALN